MWTGTLILVVVLVTFFRITSCGGIDEAVADAVNAEARRWSDSLTLERAANAATVELADSLLLAALESDSVARAANTRANQASRAHGAAATELEAVLVGQDTALALVGDLRASHLAAIAGKDVTISRLERSSRDLRVRGDTLLSRLLAFQSATDSTVLALTLRGDFWEAEARRLDSGIFGLNVPKWVGPVGALVTGLAVGLSF